MKIHLSHQISALLLSAIFLLAGTGFNVIRYCCQDCAKAGIEKVAEMSCNCIHHHHHTDGTEHQSHPESENMCFHNLEMGCSLTRITVDVPSIQDSNVFSSDISLLHSCLICLFPDFIAGYDAETFKNQLFTYHPNIPKPLKGRQILSQNSVFLI